MTRFLVKPYRPDSAGAKKLITALEGSVLPSPYTSQAGDCVINWGTGGAKLPKGALNTKIEAIINKMDFFIRLRDTDFIPDFRTTRTGAESLNFPVFCRTTLEGKDGDGIVIAQNVTGLVAASLYVEFAPKTAEYRVHVGRFSDGSISLLGSQKKQWSGSAANPVWTGDDVRMSDEWDTAPPAVTDCVIGAFKKFPEVTFAGFDCIYDSASGKAYVLEANTAPMMTPTTVKRYSQFFRDYVARRDGKPVVAAPVPASKVEEQHVIDVAPDAPVAPSTAPWANPIKAAPPTRENVIWLLDNGMVKLDVVIDGYIKSLQR